MSSDTTNYFTKDNLDMYLKELAKEFRKLNGKSAKAEIILVGGASILANYGFRDMTTDVDAIIHAGSVMREAINHVRDKYDLPKDWINADFMRTSSYSPKLNQYAKYYCTYSNVLEIRTISAEYLIAMKLRSGRKYKSDLSDIIGVLKEHKEQGKMITLENINNAVENLYGGWDCFSEESRKFINSIMMYNNYEEVFASVKEEEYNSKNVLVDFQEKYPGVMIESNVNYILESLKARR